jgi:hypothetical protein
MSSEQRIEELERRLARYHAQLETAVAQRDRFVLKAGWRVVRWTIVAGVFVGAVLASWHWYPGLGWLARAGIALAAAVLALLLTGLVGLWLERIEGDESGKFWRLPRWEADGD